VGEFWEANGGAEIGEEGEVLAQWKKGGALRLLIGREAFPLGTADRAEENGVGGAACLQRGLGEGVAVGVDGRASDEALGEGELEGEFLGDRGQDAEGFGHDFGTDAVTGEDSNF
jgi:hypothetical protein